MGSKSALCATVTADTMADLCRHRDAVAGAELVELRLDGVRDADPVRALAGRRTPVILTCRSRHEGGCFDGPETERVALLRRAWEHGAEWVDIEASADTADLMVLSGGRRVVLSWHDFHGVPTDLEQRAHDMAASGAEVVKIAVAVRTLHDVIRLQQLGRQLSSAVIIGMGPRGLPSRLLAARMHSRWTYAGAGVAPGQVSIERMRREFGADRVQDTTAVYTLLGNPVSHSVSPAMHNAAFRAAGLDAVYVPCEASEFAEFQAFAEAFGVQGASVTAPFKIDAFTHAATRDAEAEVSGAVNTLRRQGAAWSGRNTDAAAFLAPLESAAPIAGSRVAVLGAGGAARTVAGALRRRGAQVTVHARRQESARVVAAASGVETGAWPPEAAWDVLVNATPVGTWPAVDASPLPGGPFHGRLVYDLIYNPPETRLLRDAAHAGCAVIGGLDMLVAQAEAQFAWWTGHPPPRGVMREAALWRLHDGHDQEDARRTP